MTKADDPREAGADEAMLAAARVLALLDASQHSLAALSLAVELAEREGVELVALYVEDQDLLHSVAFPFAREIGAVSGLARRLTTPQLEASLARQAQRVARALEGAVAGRELRHSLRISRGRVISEALSIAGPGDVMLLGRSGVTSGWGGALGSTSRGLILSAPCPVVIWDDQGIPVAPGPLRVLADPRQGEAGLIPGPLAALFDTLEPIPRSDAATLARRLAVCRNGALLLHRGELETLLGEDPDWLLRLTIPLVVVP
ncbi:universal stress protein [Halomonas nitroreducens]|uniref:Universal stress protein n=1 Tax=Halomonas nitroreducens TaxID=447425 RepID=A0A431V6W7_9GAMM|nr:universal stress protein [Halomonas nitroreducens]RTR06379.1 universal stress protein [Halomonas nitroreducens]